MPLLPLCQCAKPLFGFILFMLLLFLDLDRADAHKSVRVRLRKMNLVLLYSTNVKLGLD